MHGETMDQTAPTLVAAFYKFVDIGGVETMQRELRDFCAERDIRGTILLAREGINATISGPPDDIEALVSKLRSDARFATLDVKFSRSPAHPFQRFKVKIKPEIVTFGGPDVSPSARTGHLVEPREWNALISDPDVLVVDTRNDYEVAIGTFERAVNPKTRSFGEFRAYVANELTSDPHRKIAMFCTGGIRCEKASAYLLAQGFTDIHQLSGGILKYLEEIPAGESLWRGECFVFDERVALEHGVRPGRHELCARCGAPRRKDEPGSDIGLCADCRRATGADAGP